jgi:hypothetical protein
MNITMDAYLRLGDYLRIELQQRGVVIPPGLRSEMLGWWANELGWHFTR